MKLPALISAAGYAVLGVAGIVRPAAIPASFGASAPTPAARTELRAVYGGMPLVTAGLLLASPASAKPIGVITAGFAAARIGSVLIERQRPSVVNALLIAVESAAAVGLLRSAG